LTFYSSSPFITDLLTENVSGVDGYLRRKRPLAFKYEERQERDPYPKTFMFEPEPKSLLQLGACASAAVERRTPRQSLKRPPSIEAARFRFFLGLTSFGTATQNQTF
jgi:hypothetical protein